MAAKKKAPGARPSAPESSDQAIEQLSKLIRSADRRVNETVKWNAPNFAVGDQDFATFHLRAKQGVQLILHFGAKKRANIAPREAIADPAQLLKWLANVRATITWSDYAEVRAKRAAFVALIKSWIKFTLSLG